MLQSRAPCSKIHTNNGIIICTYMNLSSKGDHLLEELFGIGAIKNFGRRNKHYEGVNDNPTWCSSSFSSDKMSSAIITQKT